MKFPSIFIWREFGCNGKQNLESRTPSLWEWGEKNWISFGKNLWLYWWQELTYILSKWQSRSNWSQKFSHSTIRLFMSQYVCDLQAVLALTGVAHLLKFNLRWSKLMFWVGKKDRKLCFWNSVKYYIKSFGIKKKNV